MLEKTQWPRSREWIPNAAGGIAIEKAEVDEVTARQHSRMKNRGIAIVDEKTTH
jgi:hypothetical protein